MRDCSYAAMAAGRTVSTITHTGIHEYALLFIEENDRAQM